MESSKCESYTFEPFTDLLDVRIGLKLTRKDILDKLAILKRMKANIDALRSRILKRVKEKLQAVELTAEVRTPMFTITLTNKLYSCRKLVVT